MVSQTWTADGSTGIELHLASQTAVKHDDDRAQLVLDHSLILGFSDGPRVVRCSLDTPTFRQCIIYNRLPASVLHELSTAITRVGHEALRFSTTHDSSIVDAFSP